MDVRAEPRRTHSIVGRAYWAFHDRKRIALRHEFLPWVSTENLEAVEALAELRPGDPVAALHRQMIEALTADKALDSDESRTAFRRVYDQAVAMALPATTAYLRHAQVINEISRNHSLSQVQLEALKSIDRAGHADPTFNRFGKELAAKLGLKTEHFDVIAYSQFFEIYGEAITLQHLRSRPGLKAERVEESTIKGEGRPDFICALNDGAPFYIEVKSLDIVGGEFRHREMMDDGSNMLAELERRRERDLANGHRVSTVEGDIAPYKPLGRAANYDPCSLKLVIDTLRAKCRSAFKPSQFELGPTFALAVVDRLLVPGGRHALAPYYFEPEPAGCCITGVLWHLAYGRIGAPIFRAPEFEGRSSFEATLTTDGLYSDPNQPFFGEGLILLDTHCGTRVAYGLSNPSGSSDSWSSDEIEEALDTICDAQNDAGNSFGWQLSDARNVGAAR